MTRQDLIQLLQDPGDHNIHVFDMLCPECKGRATLVLISKPGSPELEKFAVMCGCLNPYYKQMGDLT